MTFKKWLVVCEHDQSKLSEEEITKLKATFESLKASGALKLLEAKAEPAKPVVAEPAKPVEANAVVDVKKLTETITAEVTKSVVETTKIQAMCADHPEVLVKALEAGWGSETVEREIKLKNLEAARDKNTSGFHLGGGRSHEVKAQDMEIAILRAGGYSDDKIIKEYGQEAIEASDKEFGTRLGLQESMIVAARANGYTGRAVSFKSDDKGIFAAAMAINASTSFSTLGGLNGIFSNVMGKRFVEGFMNVDQSWREVSGIGSVNDFKEVSKYSLSGDMKYKQVGPGGELKHGEIGSVKYVNQADTYGILFGINRQNMINDDLDVLSTVPNRMGRGAGINFNDVFWTRFLNNAAFYTAGNNNLIEVGPLSIAELRRMVTASRLQTDPDGRPMANRPTILLTGVENESLAQKLFMDDKIVSGNTVAELDGNEHKGKYKAVSSPYISDTTLGGSATESYLLVDPSISAVINTVFLNGVQTPIVEQNPANFDTLGLVYRAYQDFGVEEEEFRAGVKSKGAA